MVGIGDRLPSFNLQAVVGPRDDMSFTSVTDKSWADKWRVLFFWPMDFTFVCPTEIAEFAHQNGAFAKRDAVLLGISTDSHYVHQAWREHNPMLAEVPFPMVADIKRELSQHLGVLDANAGVALRATFIVDPEGKIRWINVNDLAVGRNVDEVLRALDALQTGALTPCNWKPGQKTLS